MRPRDPRQRHRAPAAGGGLVALLHKLRTGDALGARSTVEQMVERKPDLALGHLFLGNAYLKEGRLEDAVQAFDRALDLNPSFAPAPILAGLDESDDTGAGCFGQPVEVQGGALALGSRGRAVTDPLSLDLAEQRLKTCLAREPESVVARLLLANARARDGHADEASALVDGVIRDNPEVLVARQLQGLAHAAGGDLEAARAAFRQLAEIAPERPVGHYHYGNACLALGDLEEAERVFRALGERFRNVRAIQYRLVDVLVRRESYAEAIPVLNNLVRRARGKTSAHQWLGRCYTRLGRHDLAVEAYRAALRADERVSALYPEVRALLEDVSDFERAAEEVTRVLTGPPSARDEDAPDPAPGAGGSDAGAGAPGAGDGLGTGEDGAASAVEDGPRARPGSAPTEPEGASR